MEKNHRGKFTEKVKNTLASGRPSEPNVDSKKLSNITYINQKHSASGMLIKEENYMDRMDLQLSSKEPSSAMIVKSSSQNDTLVADDEQANCTEESFYK